MPVGSTSGWALRSESLNLSPDLSYSVARSTRIYVVV